MKNSQYIIIQNQLPDGIYCYPDPEIKVILKTLKPNNVCESILGLNDYLTTALPNTHQISCLKRTEPFTG